MLFLLLKFLYILLLSIPYGVGAYRGWYRYACRWEKGAYPFPLVALSGFMLTGMMATWLSLLMPLALPANVVVLAGGMALCMACRRTLYNVMGRWRRQLAQQPTLTKVTFIWLLVFALYLSAGQTLAYDEGLYYIQFIKWMQQYPVVPGLANLHERFGFNSHWHVISALFNWGFLTGQSCNQLNGVLYLLVALYLLPALGTAPRGISWWMKIGLLAGIHLPQVLVYNMTAPAADMAVFYLCAVLLVLWMEAIDDHGGLPDTGSSSFIYLCTAFLVTVKVSAVTVLLLPALLLVKMLRERAYRQVAVTVTVMVVTVLPWCIRNVILSGYLVYPFEKLDLFTVDWKAPAAATAQVRSLIREWAYYLNRDRAVFEAAGFLEKTRIWYSHNLRLYDQLLILGTLILPPALWWRRKLLPGGLLHWVIFLYAGLGFWFMQAPDPRFAYGFLVPAWILLAYLLLMKAGAWRFRQAVIIAGIICLQAGTLLLYRHLHKQFLAQGAVGPVTGATWWMPAPYFNKPFMVHTQPFRYNTPVDSDRCWDAPLPCTYQLPDGVRMRGKGWGDGFYIRK